MITKPKTRMTLKPPYLSESDLQEIELSKSTPIQTQPVKKRQLSLNPLRKSFKPRSAKAGTSKLRNFLTQKSQQKKMRPQLSPIQKKLLRELQFKRLNQNSANLNNVNMREVVNYHDSKRNRVMYEDFLENQKLSENTKNMLQRVLRIQTKANRDNMRMQRVLRERRILSNATNLLRAPNLFKRSSQNLDPTGISEDNILKAPNVFRHSPENEIMRTGRPNILQTKEAGNNLFF